MSTTAAREVAAFCYAGAWLAPVPSLVVDNQTVVFANAAALRMLDYDDASELIGRPIDRVLHSDALVAELTRREVLTATGQSLIGVPTKLRSGRDEPFQTLANVIPIEVGESQLTLFTFDAEAKPEARCKLAAAPDLGTFGPALGWAILESVPTPTMIQDLDTILFVNAAARPYFGATDRSQLEGRPIISVIHPDGMLAALERVVFVFATHQRLHGVPLKLKALDGTSFHAEGDAYPMRANGRWGVLIEGRFIRRADESPGA